MKRPDRLGLRLGAAGFCLLSIGGCWLTVHAFWTGLTTGMIRGKYGPIHRIDRPVTFDIQMTLNGVASLLWIGFALIAIWIVFARDLDAL